MSTGAQQQAPASVCRVRFHNGAETSELIFHNAFVIGRADDCAVCIKSEFVSRKHLEVLFQNGQWWARDLNSSNGTFVDGERVERTALSDTTVRLGIAGPEVSFTVTQPPQAESLATVSMPAPGERTMIARYINHYFAPDALTQPAGAHTMYLRRAYQQVQARQKTKYFWMLFGLGICLLGLAGYAVYQHHQIAAQRETAKNLFYSMKSVDVEIANLEKLLLNSPSQAGVREVRSFLDKRDAMRKSYDRFLATLDVYDPKMSHQDRLILRVARIFGESELGIPPDFMREVKAYIAKWRSSTRLQTSIEEANGRGYTRLIARTFLDNDLPPQFFYLALQESNFDPYANGPPTSAGIAKGMWQFEPATAVKYGLHLGPLLDLPRRDPADDRYHFDRETRAAVRYINDLYGTDAQASGLLVMACYNRGENYVLHLVRELPENPRERNFWNLLAKYGNKIPHETYDYVFYIFSAAVIGEDPSSFGFTFNNPIVAAEQNK